MAEKISLKSYVGHRLRELLVHADIMRQKGRPRLLMLPSHDRVQCSLLRVYNLVPELRSLGWTPLVVPHQLEASQRDRVMRRFDPDLIFLQKSRHPLNDPDLLQGRPYVYDLDDADFLDERLADKTARTCRSARAVIAGSRFVADWCRQYNSETHVVWTGAPVSPGQRRAHADRAPILGWAQSDPNGYPQEFDFVEDLVGRLIAKGAVFTLRLYGWRDDAPETRLVRMRQAGVEIETVPFIQYDKFVASLQDVAVGISPVIIASEYSQGKSFGKILAYLDAMVPVVASDEVDHSAFFTPDSGVLSNDPEIWANEIADLLANAERREAIARNAFERFRNLLSREAAGRQVANVIDTALHDQTPASTDQG